MLTLASAAAFGALGGERGHCGDDVGDDDLAAGADALGGREPDAAGPAGELEDALAHADPGGVEQPLRHDGASLVDVVGVLAPVGGDGGPHAVHVAALLWSCPSGWWVMLCAFILVAS